MVVGNVNNKNNNNNNINSDPNNVGDSIGDNTNAHPSGIPREQIDNIMSGIANTGDVKMNNHRKKLRQRFDIIKKLGQGTYGKVQLGINKETGQEVAIKTIKKCKIEAEADLVRIRREVQIMSSVQHPNIIHIYEVFENREKMVLVMEFAAGGELYDYLSERKVLSEEEARRIFRQVATAVYYCHKHKICHRDLKLENILLDEYGNAKIADFGLSNVFDDQRLLATFCGSPLYASPEIVEGTPYQGPEVDCWSLGVLLYTLVYGSMPFDGSNFKRLVKQISQGDYYEPKKPSRASSLIRDMLTVCPQKRATIEQICSHWWVNENDPVSCLELAEDLANQTPVRLDVLLSLTPAAVTAEQLVVPSSGGRNMEIGKLSGTVIRSHSVGSLREIAVAPSTEAERRILDMVAAGGEAALMPSPTRTITPTHSPIQSKRKLESTLSTDLEAVKKKEKPSSTAALAKQRSDKIVNAAMETEDLESSGLNSMESKNFSTNDMEKVGDICEQLMQSNHNLEATGPTNDAEVALHGSAPSDNKVTEGVTRQKTLTKLDPVDEENTTLLEGTKTSAPKVLKKFVNKHKTADLSKAIEHITPDLSTPVNSESCHQIQSKNVANLSKKTSGIKHKDSQNEPQSNKVTPERRKSRILETAEKFQQMNSSPSPSAHVNMKPKKFVIPGVNVGSYKKEYERRASASGVSFSQIPTEQSAPEKETVKSTTEEENDVVVPPSNEEHSITATSHISLEEARRSMENSIALLRQAQSDSTEKDNAATIVNQLCAKTENINMDDLVQVEDNATIEHERKLQNARTIIGNAIQPAQGGSMDDGQDDGGGIKTSTASITLKSATLPRRKTGGNTDVQLDIKPRSGTEQSTMHFTTEMQHPVADLRTAPPRDTRISYSPPIKSIFSARAASLEPKEHIIPIQRVPYTRTTSNLTTRSGSLSRQSTNDSDAETTSATSANLSQSTIVGSSQPIKKSPREFIIPIAVEGGGYIKPREDSTESSSIPSHRNITSSSSTFNRVRPGTRRISSLLNDDNSPFQKFRTSARNRSCDGIDDEIPFTLHKLRSSRPMKKFSQETDSQSSGEEDDDDGFEILTAENLFSTLLQRVRALTNRLNVNHDITAGFPDSKSLFNNMRQAQNPFWNQEPFSSSRRNNVSSNMTAPWRHSVSRDIGGKMDSLFTTSTNNASAGVGVGVGAGSDAAVGSSKLPRGEYHRIKSKFLNH